MPFRENWNSVLLSFPLEHTSSAFALHAQSKVDQDDKIEEKCAPLSIDKQVARSAASERKLDH